MRKLMIYGANGYTGRLIAREAAKRGLQPGRVSGGNDPEQLARWRAREHGEGDLGTHRLHAEQHEEQVALLLGGKAVEGERVVADDEMGVEDHVAPDRRHMLERLRRHRKPVSDAAAVDDDVVAAAHRHPAGDERDHADTPATARASGEWLR